MSKRFFLTLIISVITTLTTAFALPKEDLDESDYLPMITTGRIKKLYKIDPPKKRKVEKKIKPVDPINDPIESKSEDNTISLPPEVSKE